MHTLQILWGKLKSAKEHLDLNGLSCYSRFHSFRFYCYKSRFTYDIQIKPPFLTKDLERLSCGDGSTFHWTLGRQPSESSSRPLGQGKSEVGIREKAEAITKRETKQENQGENAEAITRRPMKQNQGEKAEAITRRPAKQNQGVTSSETGRRRDAGQRWKVSHGKERSGKQSECGTGDYKLDCLHVSCVHRWAE